MAKNIKPNLAPIGRLIWASKAARFYRNGDGTGFVWHWWHPLTWVLAPISFVLQCAITGIPEAFRYRHEIGFGMDPWFIANPSRLEWLS